MGTMLGQAPRENVATPSPRWLIFEGIILLAAAPFLLAPEVSPLAAAIALLGLAIIWLVALRVHPFPATAFNLVFLPWGLALIVGILATADPSETLSKATGLILGLAVWRYVVVAVRVRSHILKAAGLMLLICLGFSFLGVLGLEAAPKIPLIGRINPFGNGALPDLGGFTVHPNQLAGLICLYLPLLISLPASSIGLSSRWRFVLVPAAILTVLILILTQSRGGWLSAALGLFVLLVLWALALPPSDHRRALRLMIGGLLLIALLALIWIDPGRIWDFWLNPPRDTVLGTFTTLNYRKELWPWAMTAIEDFPFSGVGLGAFRLVAFRLYPLTIAVGDIGHAHNIFLQTALDLGLPGLVVYLAILLVAATIGWRVARRDAEFRAISLGLLAGLVSFHIFGLADAVALGAKPAVVFWFALGLLAAMNKRELAEPEVAGVAPHSSKPVPHRER